MSLWTKITNFFNPAIRWINKFLKELFDTFMKIAIAELIKIAKEIVNDLADSDMRSKDKRAEAFRAIKDSTKKKGLEYKDHLINLAIELCVAKLKKRF